LGSLTATSPSSATVLVIDALQVSSALLTKREQHKLSERFRLDRLNDTAHPRDQRDSDHE